MNRGFVMQIPDTLSTLLDPKGKEGIRRAQARVMEQALQEHLEREAEKIAQVVAEQDQPCKP